MNIYAQLCSSGHIIFKDIGSIQLKYSFLEICRSQIYLHQIML